MELLRGIGIVALAIFVSLIFNVIEAEASTELKQYALSEASKMGLGVLETKKMMYTITCESKWNPKAISPGGDRGLVQINRKWNPDVSDKQAFDPYFSIRWMVTKFKQGKQHLWSCYNKVVDK